jgi:hypothetical protein
MNDYFTKGMDGRIDDPNAGWKGRELWTTYATRTMFHLEIGKGTFPKVVRFFADQSQSILDNLVALLRRSRAWNCSVGIAAVMSGISRHSSRRNGPLDGWGSAIRPTADHGSVVRQFAI